MRITKGKKGPEKIVIKTKPKIMFKAEQYIIIRRYEKYSRLFPQPNNKATERIKPI